jgi:mannose-6-phosphate isomerase-like protein (cupin superfamily)
LCRAAASARFTTTERVNRHRGLDQWLFVVSGEGVATMEEERVDPKEGTLIPIPLGPRHEIRNTGAEALRTLNVYAPPAYTLEGDELPAGKAR